MAKRRYKKPVGKKRAPEPVSLPEPASEGTEHIVKRPVFKWTYLLLAAIPAMITWFAYRNALENEITNWDDEKYILKNELIKDYTPERMKYWFSHFYFGNYHPFTMITYMWEYKHSGNHWKDYHLHNVLLHLLNVLLVFLLIWLISGKLWVSGLVALLHGLHPMHVESVAWLSERKDVLFAFFYLLSMILYMLMWREKKGRGILYFLSFIAFVCALFSKAAAVTLAPSLFLLDYISSRKFTIRMIAEKIPFLLLALLFGIIAVKAQQSTESIASFETFTLLQRCMFAAYGLVMYAYMLLVPAGLSCFHPYPFLLADGSLPMIYYISPFIALAMFAAIWYGRKKCPVAVFGFLFYFINVALVLQFISVGNAVMAERYSYIPYIGLFYILASGAQQMMKRKRNAGIALTGLFLCGSAYFAYATSERCKVWKNSETLWTDFISKYPTHEKGYTSRANYYAQQQEYDKAFDDFSMAIKLKPDQARPYAMRGNIFSMRGQLDKAMKDYNTAIRLDPEYPDVYFNRAVTFSINKQYDKAFADYSKAIELDPENMQAYLNRAYAYIEAGKYDAAMQDCEQVLKINPNNKDAHMYKGLALFNIKRYDEAMQSFGRALRIEPGNSAAWYNLAVCLERKGRYKEALQHVKKARSLGYQVPQSYVSKLEKKIAETIQ